MNKDSEQRRKRGVCASRARLHHALAQAGLKTQSALAGRIADLEGLDTAPRDLVNRVFRERPVEPRSLERLARALGVEAYTLYKRGSDALSPVNDPPVKEKTQPKEAQSAAPRRPRTTGPRLWVFGVAIGLLLATDLLLHLPSDRQLACGIREFFQPLQPAQKKLGLVIAHFEKDPDNRAQAFLATQLVDDEHLDPYVSVVKTCRILSLDTLGEARSRRDTLRAQGREMLQRIGALVMLWGRIDGDRLEVRFISTWHNHRPVTIKRRGRSFPVEVARLQIPVALGKPADSMREVKGVVLELMHPQTQGQIKLRSKAMRAYTSVGEIR